MSNGGKFYGEKKMSWKGDSTEGVRAAMKASPLSRHLEEVRVWAMGISGRRAPQTQRTGSAKALR